MEPSRIAALEGALAYGRLHAGAQTREGRSARVGGSGRSRSRVACARRDGTIGWSRGERPAVR